jgi:hypothetical protein
MTDRFPASHAEHDPLLIAAYSAGDLGAPDSEQAALLASTCRECGLLAADLRAIATATAVLPKPVRRRDFSLSAEDAARLRKGGWRGFMRTLAGPRSAALKPLATGLTTLGIAGLLLAALPAIQLGSSAGSPIGATAPTASSEADTTSDNYFAPAASTGPDRVGAPAAGSAPPRDRIPAARPVASPIEVDTAGGDEGPVVPDGSRAPAGQPTVAAPDVRAPSPLRLLSGALLALGLLLFGIRWTARRLSDA